MDRSSGKNKYTDILEQLMDRYFEDTLRGKIYNGENVHIHAPTE